MLWYIEADCRCTICVVKLRSARTRPCGICCTQLYVLLAPEVVMHIANIRRTKHTVESEVHNGEPYQEFQKLELITVVLLWKLETFEAVVTHARLAYVTFTHVYTWRVLFTRPWWYVLCVHAYTLDVFYLQTPQCTTENSQSQRDCMKRNSLCVGCAVMKQKRRRSALLTELVDRLTWVGIRLIVAGNVLGGYCHRRFEGKICLNNVKFGIQIINPIYENTKEQYKQNQRGRSHRYLLSHTKRIQTVNPCNVWRHFVTALIFCRQYGDEAHPLKRMLLCTANRDFRDSAHCKKCAHLSISVSMSCRPKTNVIRSKRWEFDFLQDIGWDAKLFPNSIALKQTSKFMSDVRGYNRALTMTCLQYRYATSYQLSTL